MQPKKTTKKEEEIINFYIYYVHDAQFLKGWTYCLVIHITDMIWLRLEKSIESSKIARPKHSHKHCSWEIIGRDSFQIRGF